MPLIFSLGSSSIVQYLRGFYCGPQNEGPESPSFQPCGFLSHSLPLCSSSLLVSFLCCSFQLLSPWQSSTPIWTVLKFLSFQSLSVGTFWSIQFADIASTLCRSLHSWHNFLAFTLTLRHTLKQVISPKLYSLFHSLLQIGNTRHAKAMLRTKHCSHLNKGTSRSLLIKHPWTHIQQCFSVQLFLSAKSADVGIHARHTGHITLVNHRI